MEQRKHDVTATEHERAAPVERLEQGHRLAADRDQQRQAEQQDGERRQRRSSRRGARPDSVRVRRSRRDAEATAANRPISAPPAMMATWANGVVHVSATIGREDREQTARPVRGQGAGHQVDRLGDDRDRRDLEAVDPAGR